MNTKNRIWLLAGVVLSVLLVSPPSRAREFAEIYTQCGLGAMIAPHTEAVAAVTNVTWDLGTTAISSNISSPDSCQGGKAKTAAFIHDSYHQLASNLASGKGPYLDTLVALAGCRADAQPALVSALRRDFSQVVARPGYATENRFQHADGMYNMLYHRIGADFSDACSVG